MRRILLGAVLAVGGLLGTSAVASADIGDIDQFTISGNTAGTAEVAQVSGQIRCTTTIDYGLVVKVSQDGPDGATDPFSSNSDADIEGVGAFGPNQGNEANTPCSTNLQSYEVLVQRNRDSGTYQDTQSTGLFMGVFVDVGTSAENGNRGPGPFIGDSEYEVDTVPFVRVDP